MPYVKFTSTKNPQSDWTEEIVLERDNSGNVTKSIKKGDFARDLEGNAVEVDDEVVSSLRGQFNLSTSEKIDDDKKKVEFVQQGGDDTRAAGPILGDGKKVPAATGTTAGTDAAGSTATGAGAGGGASSAAGSSQATGAGAGGGR